MRIKKLLAGAVAAALTVTSLAVVNVSAAEDKVVTHSFIYQANELTVTYSKTISARAGANLNEMLNVQATDTVAGVTGKKAFTFTFQPIGNWGLENYDAPSQAVLRAGMYDFDYPITNWQDMTVDGSITVKGTDDKNNAQEVSTDFFLEDGKLKFFGVIDTETDHLLAAHELDLGRVTNISSITIKQKLVKDKMNFALPSNVGYWGFGNTGGAWSDRTNTCSDAGFEKFLNQSVVSSKDETVTYSNRTYNVGGRVIDFDTVYSLENNKAEFTDANQASGTLQSGSSITFLQWVNDNIAYNKGCKIRFTFAPGEKTTVGTLETFAPSGVGGQRPWFTEGDSTSGTAKANDMVLAVNSHSSNKLRQEVVMTKEGNNYVAEFDWDTVMAASPTTTTAHVTSISFALNNGGLQNGSTKIPGDNIENIAIKDNPTAARLIQIDIVIPGNQSNDLPGNNNNNDNNGTTWDNTITKVEDPNSGVIAEGTNKAITGNGAAYIKVVGKLTTNSLTYDVKFVNKDGEYVQPAGEITLTLPLPKEIWDRTVNKVTHHKGDGTSEQLDIINKDTYKTDHFVKVVTTSFSGFEIELEPEDTEPEETKAPETQAPVTTEAPTTTAAAGNTNQPTNDKNTPATGFAIAIVPAAIAAAAAVVAKKRK